MSGGWKMLRCSCGHSFGSRRGGRPSCSRCGESTGIATTGIYDSSVQLAEAIAHANLPTEIQEDVESRLKRDFRLREQTRKRGSVELIHRIIRKATANNGELTLAKLRESLEVEGIAEPTAEEILGDAEIQGVLFRSATDTWRWL